MNKRWFVRVVWASGESVIFSKDGKRMLFKSKTKADDLVGLLKTIYPDSQYRSITCEEWLL